MNIYLRKILKHDITHQISVTKEVLNGFFEVYEEKEVAIMKGKNSGYSGNVTFLLSTDPRFGGDIKQIINAEGGIQEEDILLFVKSKGQYIIEIISVGDTRHKTFLSMMNIERHLVINIDDEINGTSSDDGEEELIDEKSNANDVGANILLYGVPGAGKSHIIDSEVDEDFSERVVFHPDYTYSDFVGQILPRAVDGKLRYVFEPGPFTKMLKKAYDNPRRMHYLVIEEINRGNAPAIFGDIFQLLDRNEDGEGKYSIVNYDIAAVVFGDENHKLRIPSNLTIYATMNTSDQNVFTLDTAFQRRWEMHLVKNDVYSATHAKNNIEGSSVSWGNFASVTNAEIIRFSEETGNAADKRLGAYFARTSELSKNKFPEKVLKYLWDDAFKMDHYAYFNDSITSLDDIIEVFELNSATDPLKSILRANIYSKMLGLVIDGTEDKDVKDDAE